MCAAHKSDPHHRSSACQLPERKALLAICSIKSYSCPRRSRRGQSSGLQSSCFGRLPRSQAARVTMRGPSLWRTWRPMARRHAAPCLRQAKAFHSMARAPACARSELHLCIVVHHGRASHTGTFGNLRSSAWFSKRHNVAECDEYDCVMSSDRKQMLCPALQAAMVLLRRLTLASSFHVGNWSRAALIRWLSAQARRPKRRSCRTSSQAYCWCVGSITHFSPAGRVRAVLICEEHTMWAPACVLIALHAWQWNDTDN